MSISEQAQFREAFHENLDLVFEILEAMRSESVFAGDSAAAQFVSGIQQVLGAFARLQGVLAVPLPVALGRGAHNELG